LKGTIDGKNSAHHFCFGYYVVKKAGTTIVFLAFTMGITKSTVTLYYGRLALGWPRCTVKGRVVSFFRSSSATTDAKPAIRTLSVTHSSLCRET